MFEPLDPELATGAVCHQAYVHALAHTGRRLAPTYLLPGAVLGSGGGEWLFDLSPALCLLL